MSVREVMVKNLAFGLLTTFVILALFGCGDGEIPKKVNLNKRNHNNAQGNYIRQMRRAITKVIDELRDELYIYNFLRQLFF